MKPVPNNTSELLSVLMASRDRLHKIASSISKERELLAEYWEFSVCEASVFSAYEAVSKAIIKLEGTRRNIQSRVKGVTKP